MVACSRVSKRKKKNTLQVWGGQRPKIMEKCAALKKGDVLLSPPRPCQGLSGAEEVWRTGNWRLQSIAKSGAH